MLKSVLRGVLRFSLSSFWGGMCLLGLFFSVQSYGFFGTSCTLYSGDEPMSPITFKCHKKEDTLYVNGSIDGYLYDEINLWGAEGYRVPGQKVLKKINLNSNGGKMFSPSEHSETAETIVELISEKKLDTYVDDEKVCLSACVPIFASGQKRVTAVSAKFMVHSPRFSLEGLNALQKKCGVNLDAPECKEEIDEMREKQLESLDRYFSLIESFGVSRQIREDYMGGAPDPKAPMNGNLIGLKDLYFDGLKAVEYGLALSLSSM